MIEASQAEFQRHLRNLFAVLRVIVRRSSGKHVSVEEYAAHLEGRIGALARANEMLMRAPPVGVDLEEIICGELLSQVAPTDRYTVNGPEIRLAHAATAPLALTLHELATNALLHGAFGAPGGRVSVSWLCEHRGDRDWLRLTWIESGLSLDTRKPMEKGFGAEIIERTLPYELGAEAYFSLKQTGAEASICIPADTAKPMWRPASSEIDR